MLSYLHRSFIKKPNAKICRLFNGSPKVSVGQRVLPHEIVGINYRRLGFRIFHLDQILSAPPDAAGTFLQKPIGSNVCKNEILAQRSSFWGLKKVVFRSPIDGVIKMMNEENGELVMEYPLQLITVPSGVEGKVVEVLPDRGVMIESSALIVKARLGLGLRREGILKVMQNREIPLTSPEINEDFAGKIVLAASSVGREALYKLITVKAKGLITGGIDWKVFNEIKSARGGIEDVGLTVLVLGGFGNLPIPQEHFSFLEKFDGRLVIASGIWKKLILPNPQKLELDNPLGRELLGSVSFPVVEPLKGFRVRLLSFGRFGVYGTIAESLGKVKVLESQIESLTIPVKLENGEMLDVPFENLEIID